MKLYAVKQRGPYGAERIEIWDNDGKAQLRRIGGSKPMTWDSERTPAEWLATQTPRMQQCYKVQP